MNSTHAQIAYQNLRSRLIAGEFPPGSRLRYGPIGQELGISATPVREAMGLLANEGLIELVPQLGAVVRTLNRQEMIELYELREAIEPYAAAKAAERAGSAQVAAMNRTLDRMVALAANQSRSSEEIADKQDTSAFEKADLAFHMLIIESTGNRFMVKSSESSNALLRVFAAERHQYTAEIMESTCRDHRRILAGIETRQADKAGGAMQQHIAAGLALTLESLDASGSSKWEVT